MIFLVPAYEPTFQLVNVVRGLRDADPTAIILVVDDGSGPAYAHVFETARAIGARVLSYEPNRGKGHALKTGFAYALWRWPGQDVVTADSDGQHSTSDILRVAASVTAGTLVLGGRAFAGEVPLRSRFGNAMSRHGFRLAAGITVHDTQTGLRGYPAASLPWLATVRGSRFEYELNVLLGAKAAGLRMLELPIETIYLNDNASSHFRPIVDSVRVVAPLLRFAVSSVTAFVIDLVLLQLLFVATGSLLASVVLARITSSTVNFTMNRQLVFGSREPGNLRRHVLGYFGLVAVLMGASYVMIAGFTALGWSLLVAKIVADVSLYSVSFLVQKRLFTTREGLVMPLERSAATDAPARAASPRR